MKWEKRRAAIDAKARQRGFSVTDPGRRRFCATVQALYHRKVKVRDLIGLLESSGWQLKRIKGSHRQFGHPTKGMVVTVPGKLGKDVPAGTLKAILRSAGI